MKKIFPLLLLVLILSSLAGVWVLADRPGELGKMQIGAMFFKKGEKLSIATKCFEGSIKDAGHDWSVIIDPKVSERLAKSNFGGSGSASNFTYIISKTYDVRPVVFTENKLILFMAK